MNTTAFAHALRNHMDGRGWSQTRLARVAGVDNPLLGRFLAGTRHPAPATVGRLASGLRLDDETTDALYIAAALLPPGVSSETLIRALALARVARSEAA